MDNENKLLTYATAFAVASGGLLILSLVPSALCIRKVQKAQAFNLIADGNRMISLSKTYDAKAAAAQVKTVMKKVV